MKQSEIKVGGLYLAKVNGKVVTVRVDDIGRLGKRDTYHVTNLTTGRKTTFHSAAKFRAPAQSVLSVDYSYCAEGCRRQDLNANKPWICMECAKRVQYQQQGFTSAEQTELVSVEEHADPFAEDAPTAEASPGAMTSAPTTAPAATTTGDEQSADPTSTSAPPADVSTGDSTDLSSGSTAPPNAVSGGMPSSPDTEGEQGADPTVSVAAPVAADPAPVMVPANLAARIAATVPTHTTGRQVAGMTPNPEQEAILTAAARPGLRALVIGAGAGSGKTATLRMLECVLSGRGQYTAFNKSLVEDGRSKFVKASVNTTHSLAFRAVGKLYQHRLGGERMRSHQVAHILGIEKLVCVLPGQGEPDENGQPTDGYKTLRADYLAGQVIEAVKRFCQSDERCVSPRHIWSDTLAAFGKDVVRQVRDYLLPFCHRAWEDITSLNGRLPFSHDCYVKIWQLGQGTDRPVIAADYILLDEAQDTAPVFLDIIRQQTHALLVMVGDDNQQIYEWRGAVNAMRAFDGAPRLLLSQSYRFGQIIADVANSVLATLDEPTDLIMRGNPDIPSRVDDLTEAKCYLYRTNAGAVGRVMQAYDTGKKVHLIGGGSEVITWMQAALDLQQGRGTRHPDLACFDTWGEVKEYSKTDEGAELKLFVKLVETFGAEKIITVLRDMPKECDADLIVSTAHKSKGREWDTVKLGPDFPVANRMQDSDRRLLYVACTRAKLTLDISECPPFCGGTVTSEAGRSEFVPGLEIEYTVPMPTVEEQEEYIRHKGARAEVNAMVAAGVGQHKVVAAVLKEEARRDLDKFGIPTQPTTNGEFRWVKHGEKWCVRGPAERMAGERVEVVRRDGTTSTVTIRNIVSDSGDTWVYEV